MAYERRISDTQAFNAAEFGNVVLGRSTADKIDIKGQVNNAHTFIQTGSGNIASTLSYIAVTFPYAFPATPAIILLTPTGSGGANVGPLITGSLSYQSGSTTGFIAFVDQAYGGFDVGFRWAAICVS